MLELLVAGMGLVVVGAVPNTLPVAKVLVPVVREHQESWFCGGDMRISLPLNGPSKQDRAIQCNSQRSINMYPAFKQGDAKSDLVLYSHPGLVLTAIAGLGPHRANPAKFLDKLWWVSGSELISMDATETITTVGTLSSSGARVVMAPGRNYMVLVDGTYGYYTDGTTLTQITDADFPSSPGYVVYKDGFFPVNDSATDDFYINTTSEDPTAWDPLDFSTSSASPDKTLAEAVLGNDLYMLGEDTTQMYFNSGNADFPFESYPGAMPIGIGAAYSVVSSTRGLIWLGSNKDGEMAIVQASGGQYKQISDEELTWQINQLTTKSDAIAWVRRQGGVSFYEITFPAASKTWSINLDANEQASELKSFGIQRFKGNGYGYLSNRAYVGDYSNGNIYQLDFGTYTDDSDAFIRTRRTRVIHKDGLSLTFRSLILDPEAGVGLITGQGSDPQVMMRYSWDGGRTWSSDLWTSLGAIGHPEYKPTWNNLGMGYDWQFEFSCSDPVKFNLFNLFADIEVGRS